MRICSVCEKEYGDDVSLCPEDGAQTVPLGTRKEQEADPLIGRMIGSYRITKKLGKGGMGAVYAAEHPAIGSKVAIKFLHEQYARDKQIVSRFFNEAKAVNVINHDNIVKVIDYAYLDDRMPYFVMEMLDQGHELGKLQKPVGLEVAGPILLQVCEALGAAHQRNIIHRDLKPDNVFLSERSGRKHFVKLVDFGIAKLATSDAQGQTQTGMVMGTPHYMSPEQASGQTSKIDGRSDLYSLGIIMYQLATGELPFKGESFAETLVAHIAQPPKPPREINPKIPKRYEQVILKAIAKKPEDRYQTTQELATDIADVMRETGCSFELPVADGGAGQSKTQVAIPTPVGAPTRVATAIPGGTMALTAKQAAKMTRRTSAGARAALWIAGLVVGFGAVVGLKKGGVFTTHADSLRAELAQEKEQLRSEQRRSLPALPDLPTKAPDSGRPERSRGENPKASAPSNPAAPVLPGKNAASSRQR